MTSVADPRLAGLSEAIGCRDIIVGGASAGGVFTEQAYEATRSAPLVRRLLESPTTDAPGVEADPGIESAHHG